MIKNFKNIDEYVKESKLEVNMPLDNFLIYSYQDVNSDAQFIQNAYRHHYYEVSLEINECCSFQIDNLSYPLQGSRLTIVAPNRLQTNIVHEDLLQESKGFSMFIERDFLGLHFNEALFTKDFPFLKPDFLPSVLLSNKQLNELVTIFNLIYYEQQEYGNESKEIIRQLVNIIFEKTKVFEKASERKVISLPLVNQFLQLCNQSFLKFHTVKEYASELSVTPNYLTEIVREHTGQTALETIHVLKIEYAKGLLKQTNLSIKQIAYELGFENPEYFNVFFKKLTGKTPKKFRQI